MAFYDQVSNVCQARPAPGRTSRPRRCTRCAPAPRPASVLQAPLTPELAWRRGCSVSLWCIIQLRGVAGRGRVCGTNGHRSRARSRADRGGEHAAHANKEEPGEHHELMTPAWRIGRSGQQSARAHKGTRETKNMNSPKRQPRSGRREQASASVVVPFPASAVADAGAVPNAPHGCAVTEPGGMASQIHRAQSIFRFRKSHRVFLHCGRRATPLPT
jgi:hypothetical protein